MIRRHQNWPVLLAAEFKAASGRFFSWGEFDCALWAADVVRALTGTDVAADWRGTYDSAEGALEVLHGIAGGGLPEAVAAIAVEHGFTEIGPRFGQRGDVFVIERPGLPMPAVAICAGAMLVLPAEVGLARYAIERDDRAWHY